MRIPISLYLAYALTPVFSLNAQITAVLKKFPARAPEIEIRNDSPAGLTAFAVSMAPVGDGAQSRAAFVAFADEAVDRRSLQLGPGQAQTVAVPARWRAGQPTEDLFRPPIGAAAIFADGSTSGDAALLSRLVSRRRNMLQAVELSREILSDAGRHNVPKRQLIEQFRKLADSLDHWYLPEEQQVGRPLYQSMVEELMDLPELQLGSPFPPTAFVQQKVGQLDRQRTTLLESPPGLNLPDAR